MKIKKLDARGFTVDFVAVLFVLIFVVVGVGLLVASHADTCQPSSGPTSSPTSGPVSGSCTPTSSPTSGPQLAGSCSISGVSSKPSYGQVLQPSVIVTNTGSAAFAPRLMATRGGGAGGVVITMPSIQPGAKAKAALPATIVSYATDSLRTNYYQINATGSPAFSCIATYTLPASPLVITAAITNLSLKYKAGSTVAPSVALTNHATYVTNTTFKYKITKYLVTGKPVGVSSATVASGDIAPGATRVVPIRSYTIPTNGSVSKVEYTLNSTDPVKLYSVTQAVFVTP